MQWSIGDLALVATAIIALVALLRPDIERVFQRRRATIEMHPAGRLEVGFSNFGPTIGVQGTLQAISGDRFIAFSKVSVERVVDNLRHEFQWAVFRPQSLSGALEQVEIASGFLLSAAAPRRFSIQFHDSTTADNYRQSLIELQQLWRDYLQAQAIEIADLPPAQIRGIYQIFHAAHITEIAPLHQMIDRQCYWNAGNYRMTLELRTSRPAQIFTFGYTFILSDAESRSVRLNAIACQMAMCNVPNPIFNFAYPVYSRA